MFKKLLRGETAAAAYYWLAHLNRQVSYVCYSSHMQIHRCKLRVQVHAYAIRPMYRRF